MPLFYSLQVLLAVCLVGCGVKPIDFSYDSGVRAKTKDGMAGHRVDPADAGQVRDGGPLFDAGPIAGDAGSGLPIDAGSLDASVDSSVIDAGAPTPPTCAPGYAWRAERNSCVDIDECAHDQGGCGDPKYTRCRNELGAAPACVDIDECAQPDVCGGYVCHNQQAKPASCELSCPPESTDVHGDGSLCVTRVRQFSLGSNQGCAITPSGVLRCFRAPHGFNREGRDDFVQLDSSYTDTCALHDDRTVSCWDSLIDDVQTADNVELRQIAVGYNFVCALNTRDKLLCWGYRALPAAQLDKAPFAQIDASLYWACGVRRDGTITCWANNSTTDATAAVNADGGADFRQLSLGGNHICALRAGGSLKCWGPSGVALADDRVSGPNADTRTDYVQVSATGSHTCGLHANGTLTCWGPAIGDEVSGPNAGAHPPFVRIDTAYGVTCGYTLGDVWQCWGSNPRVSFDRVEPLDPPKAVRFAGGGCVARSDASVYCSPSSDSTASPAAMNVNGGKNFVAAASNAYGICGLGVDGRMECWASSWLDGGQAQIAAMANDPRNHDFIAISEAAYGWCGRRDDGSVDCLNPELGLDPSELRSITGPNADGGNFIDFVAGGPSDHSCGIRVDGTLVCWGPDRSVSWIAGPNASIDEDYVQLSLGANATCALRRGGTLRCWANNLGQVAAITTVPRQDFVKVSTSGLHTCGLRADGSLVCRGDDTNGKVSGPSAYREQDFVDLLATQASTCAIRIDGSTVCWGSYDSDTAALIVASRP